MPRTPIEIEENVEYLAILDENGEVDSDLEPDIPEDLLLKLHRAMLMARRFDERLLQLQRQGRIGTFAPITGQEAAQLGIVANLRESDWLAPSFREGAAEAWRGKPMENVILLFGGYNEGGRIDPKINTLPVSIPVGSQVLHAAGIAYGMKYRKTDDVAVAFLGDGGTSEGDFHEGLNFAGVFQLPAVFVCQNNHWAISVPRRKQTRSKTIAQKALAYGLPGIQVDGNDILAVYSAAKEAVDRARSGGGATLIECVTYRITMHTTADDPKKYRSDDEVEPWRKKDPIARFQKYLKNKGFLTDSDIESLEAEIKQEIQSSVDRAEAQFKELTDPLAMFDHFYADLPPTLAAQRDELAADLKSAQKEADHV